MLDSKYLPKNIVVSRTSAKVEPKKRAYNCNLVCLMFIST